MSNLEMQIGPGREFSLKVGDADLTELPITDITMEVDYEMRPRVSIVLEILDGFSVSADVVCTVKGVRIPDSLMPSMIEKLKEAIQEYEARHVSLTMEDDCADRSLDDCAYRSLDDYTSRFPVDKHR